MTGSHIDRYHCTIHVLSIRTTAIIHNSTNRQACPVLCWVAEVTFSHRHNNLFLYTAETKQWLPQVTEADQLLGNTG